MMIKTSLFFLSVSSSLLLSAPIATGKLVLRKDSSAKAAGIRTVFISIQDPKAASPMPCAAQKFTLKKDAEGEFLTFTLVPGSMMMMGCTEIPEIMNLKAKLDKDGNAGRDATGDIIGTVNGIKRGSRDLKITLDKEIE